MSGDFNDEPLDRLQQSLETIETIAVWGGAILFGACFWIVFIATCVHIWQRLT